MSMHEILLKNCRKKDGNSGTVVSGGHCQEWSEEEKHESRKLLAVFYAAQDKALKAKPPRVHKRTAINRLRKLLEN